MLQDKEILLGVSGSIAAYKAAELARLLLKQGAKVQVIMTQSATEFIAPLTFFSLTGREVYSKMFSGGPEVATAHIELARKADLILIAPATAKTISRIAQGMADDLLITSVIASDSPVVIAPAMNVEMYKHPAVQDNIKRISSWPGYFIAPPGAGELACGEVGFGRLAEPEELVEFCQWALAGGKQDLVGKHVVVTAGPTQEDIDPVRFITNRSSGKMGYAVARCAARRGAKVSIIGIPNLQPLPSGCLQVAARSAEDMTQAVHAILPETDILIMAAAVADYRPAEVYAQKMKKKPGELHIPLERTTDILASLEPSDKRITVGFAAETENLLENAIDKCKRKKLDMIVANDVSRADSGFATDTNQVTLMRVDAEPLPLPLMSKVQVADTILDHALQLKK